MFQYALLYGMTSQDFWFGNPQDFFVYQDAFADKEKRRYEDVDIVAWRNAYYNMLAFSQVYSNAFGKSHKKIFPEEPWTVKERKKREAKSNPMLAKFLAIKEAVNATLMKKQNGRKT